MPDESAFWVKVMQRVLWLNCILPEKRHVFHTQYRAFSAA
jgi:hypothetical protein